MLAACRPWERRSGSGSWRESSPASGSAPSSSSREALAAAGCPVTQATISRDIRELGLEKTHDALGRPALRAARRLGPAAPEPARRARRRARRSSVGGDRRAEPRRRALGARLRAGHRARARPDRAPARRRHARRRRHVPRDHADENDARALAARARRRDASSRPRVACAPTAAHPRAVRRGESASPRRTARR